MTIDPTTFGDVTVVTLRCADHDCSRFQSAQGRHLANLLAAGPWLCPDHKGSPLVQETPC